MSRVRVSDLAFSYRELEIIKHISFSGKPGEIIAFLGPSGCGKTTLLRCIAGFLSPTKGTIALEGAVKDRRAACSFVFQTPRLLPWLTVKENLRLPFKLQSRVIPETDIAHQIERMGLGGFENHFQAELSVGMAQRVTFARALAQRRTLLLLDEPFSALDELAKRDLATLLSTVVEEDALTGLFVTHSIRDAVALGDQVIVLSNRPAEIAQNIAIPLRRPRAWFGSELLPYAEQARQALERSG